MVQCEQILRGHAVDDTRGDGVHQRQAGEYRQQCGQQVVQQGLAAESPHGAAVPHGRDTGNDGGKDEGNDEHLQCLQEQAAEEGVDGLDMQPEQAAVRTREAAGNHGQHERDQYLPVQFEFD
jgi:hypothetical protein